MNKQQRIYRKLPPRIQAALLISEGWLIGSSIEQLLEDKVVKDYDIIVPSRELFQIVCKSLFVEATEAKINSMGGMKMTFPDLELDIWCEELDHFVKIANSLQYLYNMKRNVLLNKEI